MGIYTRNKTPYERRTLQDMLVPYLMYTQRYDDIANKLGELGDQSVIWNNLLSPTRDPETWNTVNDYNQRLGDTIYNMQRGNLNLNDALNQLQNMRREYNSWGTAVDNAYKRRLQFIDEQRQGQAKGFHYTIDANNISIDDLYKNPEMTYQSVDENNVYSHAFAGSQAASKRKISFQEAKAFGDEYYKYTKIMGMSGTEAIKTIADLHKFPELEQIYKRVSDQFGFNRWDIGSFDREALEASALSGLLDGITKDIDVNFYQNHERIAEINHSYDKPSGKNGRSGDDFYDIMSSVHDFTPGTYSGFDDYTASQQSIETNNLMRQLQSNAGSNDALFSSQDEDVRGSKYNNQPFIQYEEKDMSGQPTGYGYAMSKDMKQYQMEINKAIDFLNEFESSYNNTINHPDYYGNEFTERAQARRNKWSEYKPQSSDAYQEPGIQKSGINSRPSSIELYDYEGNKKTYSYQDYSEALRRIEKNQANINKALEIENQIANKYGYLLYEDDNMADLMNKIYHLEYNINQNKQYVFKGFDQTFADSQTFAKIFLDRFNKMRNNKGSVGLFKVDDDGNIAKNPTNLTYKEEVSSGEGSTAKHNYEVGMMNTPKYKGFYLSVDGEKYIGKGDIDFDYANLAIENYNRFLNDFSGDHITNQYIDLSSYNTTISELENDPQFAKRIFTYDKQNLSSIGKNDNLLQYYVVKDESGNYWKIITDNNGNIIGKLSAADAISGNFYESNAMQNDFNNMMFLNIMYGLKPDIKPN